MLSQQEFTVKLNDFINNLKDNWEKLKPKEEHQENVSADLPKENKTLSEFNKNATKAAEAVKELIETEQNFLNKALFWKGFYDSFYEELKKDTTEDQDLLLYFETLKNTFNNQIPQTRNTNPVRIELLFGSEKEALLKDQNQALEAVKLDDNVKIALHGLIDRTMGFGQDNLQVFIIDFFTVINNRKNLSSNGKDQIENFKDLPKKTNFEEIISYLEILKKQDLARNPSLYNDVFFDFLNDLDNKLSKDFFANFISALNAISYVMGHTNQYKAKLAENKFLSLFKNHLKEYCVKNKNLFDNLDTSLQSIIKAFSEKSLNDNDFSNFINNTLIFIPQRIGKYKEILSLLLTCVDKIYINLGAHESRTTLKNLCKRASSEGVTNAFKKAIPESELKKQNNLIASLSHYNNISKGVSDLKKTRDIISMTRLTMYTVFLCTFSSSDKHDKFDKVESKYTEIVKKHAKKKKKTGFIDFDVKSKVANLISQRRKAINTKNIHSETDDVSSEVKTLCDLYYQNANNVVNAGQLDFHEFNSKILDIISRFLKKYIDERKTDNVYFWKLFSIKQLEDIVNNPIQYNISLHQHPFTFILDVKNLINNSFNVFGVVPKYFQEGTFGELYRKTNAFIDDLDEQINVFSRIYYDKANTKDLITMLRDKDANNPKISSEDTLKRLRRRSTSSRDLNLEKQQNIGEKTYKVFVYNIARLHDFYCNYDQMLFEEKENSSGNKWESIIRKFNIKLINILNNATAIDQNLGQDFIVIQLRNLVISTKEEFEKNSFYINRKRSRLYKSLNLMSDFFERAYKNIGQPSARDTNNLFWKIDSLKWKDLINNLNEIWTFGQNCRLRDNSTILHSMDASDIRFADTESLDEYIVEHSKRLLARPLMASNRDSKIIFDNNNAEYQQIFAQSLPLSRRPSVEAANNVNDTISAAIQSAAPAVNVSVAPQSFFVQVNAARTKEDISNVCNNLNNSNQLQATNANQKLTKSEKKQKAMVNEVIERAKSLGLVK